MGEQSLDGRVYAIAGIGGGLGPVVARRLAAAGAAVAGAERSPERLDELAADLEVPAERWDGHAVDLLDEAATRAWCDALLARFGRVDGLLHLVGGWRGGQPLHEAPLADWDLLHGLLIRTVQHTSRAFHDPLLASECGRFVLVSAEQAQSPSNGNASYGAAKAAAEAWTLALADGFAGRGSTANIVVVEAILTARMRGEDPGGDFSGFTPAEHIAEAIAFLCSDAGGEMNGRRLRLSGRS
ncbi:MAG TPA: SDR family oxidoreductase [Solirubrobacterales bacterium]|jgi:NAD(P)-dependent dehydrogenase (short-subunit alcohol dehydrogenase family)|nr:SDR family oxidoreductase [Solirubrobacterales bacterium]